VAWLAVAALLSGCAGTIEGEAGVTEASVVAAVDRSVTPFAFTVCHGYGCWQRSTAALDTAEWRSIQSLFAQPAPDPRSERERIRAAVALFERYVGAKTGTGADRPRAPLNLGDLSQLDCVDESINTATYLAMLSESGLLAWHQPVNPARRGSFLTLNIHFTAVVREKETGRLYAVDSWFHANGQRPEIVALEDWRAGWQPGARAGSAAR